MHVFRTDGICLTLYRDLLWDRDRDVVIENLKLNGSKVGGGA